MTQYKILINKRHLQILFIILLLNFGNVAICNCSSFGEIPPKNENIINISNYNTSEMQIKDPIASVNETQMADYSSEAKRAFSAGVYWSNKRDECTNPEDKTKYNENSIKNYSYAIKNDESHGEIWYNLGNSYYFKNDFENAENAYNNSIEENRLQDDNSRSLAYFNLGNTYFMLGKDNYEKACRSYDEAIRLNPGFSDAYNNRAILRIEGKNNSEANEDLAIAIDILKSSDDPDSEIKELRAWNNKGLALSRLKLYDEALSALQNSSDIKENPYSYLYQGLIVAELDQQLQESLRLLDKALAMDNNSLSDRDRFLVESSKGNVYLRFQNYSNAVAAFSRATNITYKRGPRWDNTAAWIGNATALKHLKDRNLDALASFNQALKQDSTNSEAYYGKGDVLYELGSYGEAIKAYQDGLMREDGDNREKILKLFPYILLIAAIFLAIYAILSKWISQHLSIKNSFYKIIFVYLLIIQLGAFLYEIYGSFPWEIVFNYILLSALILGATAILWMFNGPRDEKLQKSIEKFIDAKDSQDEKKLIWGDPRSMIVKIMAIAAMFIMSCSLFIINRYKSAFEWPNGIENEIAFIIILGLLLIFVPCLMALISRRSDDSLRTAALLLNFSWLCLNSLYLYQYLWCKGWTELSSPLVLGPLTIPEGTPIMTIAIFLLFISLLFIPYLYGWHQSKKENKKLQSDKLDNLNYLSIILQLNEVSAQEKIKDIYEKIFPAESERDSASDTSLMVELKDQLKSYQDSYDGLLNTSNEEGIKILIDKCIADTQKELDSLSRAKPSPWITAVSVLSPFVIQSLSSWMIKMGVSSDPESLFSGLVPILIGT
jgi:tetratricopeptide (TPR) repeat protein